MKEAGADTLFSAQSIMVWLLGQYLFAVHAEQTCGLNW